MAKSFVLDANGKCVVQTKAWEEDLVFARWQVKPDGYHHKPAFWRDRPA